MRELPVVTKNLLIINAVVYFATLLLGGLGNQLENILGLHFMLAADFNPVQLVTYMFLHGGFAHLFFNMFALWMFGSIVERTIGTRRFFIYYMVCGIGAGLIQEMAQYAELYVMLTEQHPLSMREVWTVAQSHAQALNSWTTIGASGSVYGVLLAFGMFYPNEKMFIFPLPIPIKAKWMITAYIGIELVSAMAQSADGIAHMAHLGGMLFGFFLIRYWRKQAFGTSSGKHFFDTLRRHYEQQRGPKIKVVKDSGRRSASGDYEKDVDWQYNEERKKIQAEIDVILDKIRKSGYDSLTADEKKRLFEQSKKL